MSKEHRELAAIMFTDIVGFTAMMSQDEVKALQVLQKNRDVLKPLISQHNGEWLKEMGDGTLSGKEGHPFRLLRADGRGRGKGAAHL